MKITKTQLKQIIKEELEKALSEAEDPLKDKAKDPLFALGQRIANAEFDKAVTDAQEKLKKMKDAPQGTYTEEEIKKAQEVLDSAIYTKDSLLSYYGFGHYG